MLKNIWGQVISGNFRRSKNRAVALVAFLATLFTLNAYASDFLEPWKEKSQAIVLDAYEKNPVDWELLSENQQVAGFIAKASDGVPPPWRCVTEDETELTLCKKTFQNHWLKKQLYHSRKMIAKSIGLKWGAYHLGRPGNPIEQANHFIDFTEPGPDDLLALDIEHDDPEKWISFRDAETFVKHVKFRTGRYPVLYTNHLTARRIAARRAEFPILSRLPLWYARYRNDVRGVFPMGHWQTYALWQFSSNANCNKRRCLFRVKGTKPDIDVNASGMSVEELRKVWPFGELVPERQYPPNSDPEITFARVNEIQPEDRRIVRFSTDLTFKNDDGRMVKLASIASPTPRNLIRPTALRIIRPGAGTESASLVGDLAAYLVADLEAEFSQLMMLKEQETRKARIDAMRRGKSYGYSNKIKSSKYSMAY